MEPLWRRIAGAVPEPTRRITGGADPANPACAASGETEPVRPPTLSDPCQGPFFTQLVSAETQPEGVFNAALGSTLPQLSANGRTVAFVASQRPIAAGNIEKEKVLSNDLYVVDMADGLTRVQALQRLTELESEEADIQGIVAPIIDLSISPDGSQIAFTTARTAFPLGSPAYVTPPAAKSEMQELFDVDLGDDTLTRITHGYQGETQQSEPANGVAEGMEAGSPSFSADGNTLAFSSAATNLVYGEGNRATSVFVVSRKPFEAEPVSQLVSPAPASPNTEPAWLLNASAYSRRDGSVLLEVEVPGAGSLIANAQSSVRVKVARSHAARRGGRRSRSVGRATTTVASRRVASGKKRAGGEGLVKLALSLASGYRALALQRGGLSAHGDTRVCRARPRSAARARFGHVPAHRPSSPAEKTSSSGQASARKKGSAGAMTMGRIAGFARAGALALLFVLATGVTSGEAHAETPTWRFEPVLPPQQPGESSEEHDGRFPIALGKIGNVEFWAPNRGLLITEGNPPTVPPGVWTYNGKEWHELASVCGATDGRIAWTGPDEFWTVSDGRPGQAKQENKEPPL